MTKYIPDQARVSGSFPVVINGTLTQLTEGTNFTDSASLLAALDAAGITYSAQKFDAATGSASGRIRINGTGTGVAAGINGTYTDIAMNTWFTPTAEQLEALGRAGNLTIELEYIDPLSLGNELWAQPNFDASTSLTLNGWSISGGLGTTPLGSGALTATSLETLTAGSYQVRIDTVDAAAFRITIAGTPFGGDNMFTGMGSQTKTLTVASVTDQLIKLQDTYGDGGYRVTALSVKKVQ